ncbi:MAG: hypothetical protein OXC60_14855 [Litoreibacter sp.]|nr:hypothetical protein [Litoreibacter sp.]
MAAKRLTLAFPERTINRLEELKELTSASSITDVVREAIMTYESVAKHIGNGMTFYAQRPNGERIEVEFMIDVPRVEPDIRLVK